MVNREDGSESERLAPVIPLFGATASAVSDSSTPRPPDTADAAEEPGGAAAVDFARWRSASKVEEPSVAARALDSYTDSDGSPSDRHPARGGARSAPRLRAVERTDQHDGADSALSAAALREAAEEALVRKLRARSLSISEARLILRGFEREGGRLDSAQIDDVIDDFCRRGYLDDRVLAEQLITAGVERKGQGRVALSRALAQRGLSRDVIDAALSDLPDDDAARALEFARGKASSLTRLDHDTALRRLVGQLARRGYNGAVAMSAAKAALGEVTRGHATSGVRFVDSD